MMFYDMYSEVPREVIDSFVAEREMGRLVTVGADETPHIGLYPFVYQRDYIEMHLNRADEQFADLQARPRCVFELDDVLAVIPSYWVHPESAVMATAYHRSVIFQCQATISEDAAELAAQQTRIMARYQPEGGFRTIAPENPLYRGAIAHIAAIRLDVHDVRAKFKLGQNRSIQARTDVILQLRRRGRHDDPRAAEALQWTIDRERAAG